MISEEVRKSSIVENGFDIEPSFTNCKLNIEITSACSEKCIYCQASVAGHHKHPKMIDDELFYRVTKEAKELGAVEVGLYTQGEPLANPNVAKYIAYLKDKLNYEYVYISTNGILCTPEKLREIVDAGIDSIKFSISSVDKENFFRHHGVDSCEKCIEHVKYAYEYREKTGKKYKIYIFTIVTRFNEWELDNIINTYSPYADEHLLSDVEDGIFTIKGIKEFLSTTRVNSLRPPVSLKVPCPQLFNRIIINEKGQLCICCFTNSELTVVADLHDTSLRDALYSDEMKRIRSRHIRKELEGTVCNKCVYGIDGYMNPITDKMGFEGCYPPVYDRVDEIKKRFSDKT